MTGLSNETIPTAAFIEHFVFQEALNGDVTLAQASSAVLPRFGLKASSTLPHKETQLLTLLYCLLVLPSEIWRRAELLETVVERALADPDLLPTNKGLMSKQGIRSIRNAVSHARVYFDGSSVRFVDQRVNSSPHFESSLSYSEAINYVLVLGRAFHDSQQVQDQLANQVRPQ